MKLTTYYSLKKPEGSDVVNIDDFNYNADMIDSAIQEIKNTSSTNKTNISSLQTKVDNGQNLKLTNNSGQIDVSSQADFNTLTKTGWYYVTGNTNAPSSGNAWYLEVMSRSGGYVYQKAIHNVNNNNDLPKYERIMHNNTWTAWREL